MRGPGETRAKTFLFPSQTFDSPSTGQPFLMKLASDKKRGSLQGIWALLASRSTQHPSPCQ